MGRPKRDRALEREEAEKVIADWFPDARPTVESSAPVRKRPTAPLGMPAAGPVRVSRLDAMVEIQDALDSDLEPGTTLEDGPGKWGRKGVDGSKVEQQ